MIREWRGERTLFIPLRPLPPLCLPYMGPGRGGRPSTNTSISVRSRLFHSPPARDHLSFLSPFSLCLHLPQKEEKEVLQHRSHVLDLPSFPSFGFVLASPRRHFLALEGLTQAHTQSIVWEVKCVCVCVYCVQREKGKRERERMAFYVIHRAACGDFFRFPSSLRALCV